jgi:hypothetical protein
VNLPPTARTLAKAISASLDAAAREDADDMRAATADLAALDGEQTGVLLGAIMRMLLEEQHPDGLDGDDIRTVLEGCARWALAWLPEVDPHALLIVLAGALGIHPDDHDEVERPSAPALALHAPLLIARLLAGRARPIDPYLSAAFAEIARSEIMEAP